MGCRLCDTDLPASARPTNAITMVPPNEFWLHLHALAQSHSAEGLTHDEREENIVKQFRAMPYSAQRELVRELMQLAADLPELYPAVVSAINVPS
jgi:hypothetical protein